MSSTSEQVQQIQEMNRVTALLRRNGYSFTDHGTYVVVDDPVHTIIWGMLVKTSTLPVTLTSARLTRSFLSARS